MKAREKINALAETLIKNLTEAGYERSEMRRVLTAAVRKLGKLGIKGREKTDESQAAH